MRLIAAAALALLAGGGLDAAVDARLVDAVKRADETAVRALLAERVDPDAPAADGSTPLHWAVHRDQLGIAELLIRAGARPTAANRYGVQSAVAGVHQRQRGDDRAAARRRSRSGHGAGGGRDRADDGGAHRGRRGRRAAAGARRRRECRRVVAGTDGADVGGGGRQHGGRRGAARRRRGRWRRFAERLHAAAVRRTGRADRGGRTAARRRREPGRFAVDQLRSHGRRRRDAAGSPARVSTPSCWRWGAGTSSWRRGCWNGGPIPTRRRGGWTALHQGVVGAQDRGLRQQRSRARGLGRHGQPRVRSRAGGAGRGSERPRHAEAARRDHGAEHDRRHAVPARSPDRGMPR